MADYQMVPGTLQHIEDMVDNLRELDIEEAWVTRHRTPRQALESAFTRAGANPWVGLVDGKAECVCGTAPMSTISAIGFPYLYATNVIWANSRPFLRGSREYIAAMKREFVFLRGYVYTKNTESQRWLKWLGFTLDDAQPWGVEGKPFYPFHMEGES